MPIYGLTDKSKSFIRLAKIKKGERHDDGSMVDLDYFRLMFSYGCEDLEAEFRKVYGDKPRSINFRLAWPTIQESWDAFYTCYTTGGQLARAGSNENGLYWEWYRDHDSNQVWIRDRRPVCPEGEDFIQKPIDLNQPIYSYKNKKDKMVPVFLKPEGRLSIVVPELAWVNGKPKVGFFDFCPITARDIGVISSELAGIEFIASKVGKPLMGIPMALTRRKEMVTKNINGVLSRGPSWVVHIEMTGEWGGQALTTLDALALPSPDDLLDEDVQEAVFVDEGEGDNPPEVLLSHVPDGVGEMFPPKNTTIQQEAPESPEPNKPTEDIGKAPEIAPVPSQSRPYDPETFRAKFREGCGKIEDNYRASGKECQASDTHRKVLALALDTYCFKKNVMERHEFLGWLTGSTSTKEMSCEQVKALLHILKLSGDDYTMKPDGVAVQEIQGAHKYIVNAMKAEQGLSEVNE